LEEDRATRRLRYAISKTLQRDELLDAMMRAPQDAGMCMYAAALTVAHEMMVAPANSDEKAWMSVLDEISPRNARTLREV
jgi:hypothetical protein